MHVSVWYNILQKTPKLENTNIKHFSNWNLFDIYDCAGAFFGGTCAVALGGTDDFLFREVLCSWFAFRSSCCKIHVDLSRPFTCTS
jgi:hypothetical protein